MFAIVRSEEYGNELINHTIYILKLLIVQLNVTKQEDIRSVVGIIEYNVGEKVLAALFHNTVHSTSIKSTEECSTFMKKSLSVEVTE